MQLLGRYDQQTNWETNNLVRYPVHLSNIGLHLQLYPKIVELYIQTIYECVQIKNIYNIVYLI